MSSGLFENLDLRSPPAANMGDTTSNDDNTIELLHEPLVKDLPLWETIAKSKRARRSAAIPPEWRLLPGQVPDDQLNVINVPVECGILTARELEITATDAVALVQKLIHSEYSSYEVRNSCSRLEVVLTSILEVTLAFCKRAAIAQQLVYAVRILFSRFGLIPELGQLSQ